MPEKVNDTLPQLKSLLSKPLQETEKVLYRTSLAMKQNTYTELLFTVPQLTAYIIKREKLIEQLTTQNQKISKFNKNKKIIKKSQNSSLHLKVMIYLT